MGGYIVVDITIDNSIHKIDEAVVPSVECDGITYVGHWVQVLKVGPYGLTLMDPETGSVFQLTWKQFNESFEGEALWILPPPKGLFIPC